MSETPNTVHGRLLEAVHISGYSFERAMTELKWLLQENRWQQCGFDDIAAFQATLNWSEFRIAAEKRKDIAKMFETIGASQRATARMLGVDEGTVRRDLKPAENSAVVVTEGAEAKVSGGGPAENSATAYFDNDPQEAAKKPVAKKQKEAARLEANQATKSNEAALPDDKYRVIYADPPWSFKVWSGEGKDRAAENHYPTMTQGEIEALPIADLAADSCALFLWAVWPQLPEALSVIKTWGFEYKTCAFVWAKSTKDGERFATGMGYWTRANSEVCLLATKGSPKRLNADVHQIVAPRQEHSRKPGEVAERIMRLVDGPYIELFARHKRDGWDVWGNET